LTSHRIHAQLDSADRSIRFDAQSGESGFGSYAMGYVTDSCDAD